MTFNQWAIEAPKILNDQAKALLENCKNLTRKYANHHGTAEIKVILNDLGYFKVSDMEGKTADLKAFYQKVSALPKFSSE